MKLVIEDIDLVVKRNLNNSKNWGGSLTKFAKDWAGSGKKCAHDWSNTAKKLGSEPFSSKSKKRS